MSDIQEVAPENSLADFPKDGVFFRAVYRNLALMLFCCKINVTTVAENGENLINAHSQGPLRAVSRINTVHLFYIWVKMTRLNGDPPCKNA